MLLAWVTVDHVADQEEVLLVAGNGGLVLATALARPLVHCLLVSGKLVQFVQQRWSD